MNQAVQYPLCHPKFEWLRSTRVDSLKVDVQEFRHRETEALHIHVAADDDQNAFLVAFRTVPEDSTGVAHILEHTSLCGSRRYPVRDPFFMMIRRSLNTFMNAFTASDWTAYPFASRNRKDFQNLLGVYLDAVFFPNLNPLDFAQEGHRIEFAVPDDPDSELVFKGVVFNEMKGAMSSPVSALWQSLTAAVFPSITYHFNSGGDPEAIPNLTYQQLKAFHRSHYHPSNAVFMTFGDIPPHQHQGVFQEWLADFEFKPLNIRVPDEHRYDSPLRVEDAYALDGERDTRNKTHIVVGWLLNKSTDIEEVLRSHLLAGVLLNNGASPLRRALETTDLGCAPSPLCGLKDSMREMLFVAGLEGSNPEQAEAVERLIFGVLEEVAENGVDPAMVEALLHQLELHQREITGDGFPYGLQLMLRALRPALHGADPVSALDIDAALERLRERIKDPGFIKALVREQLLNNRHWVRLVMKPDPELGAGRAREEAERLASIRAGMDEAEKKRVIEQAIALAERQSVEDDPELLPKVGLEDVPADLPIPEGVTVPLAGIPATWFSCGTNGLFYEELVIDIPALDDELTRFVPMLCDMVTEVGSGGRDYLATQALHSAVTGGIGARVAVRGAVDDLNTSRGVFVVSGKALARNHGALTEILRETVETARFDELSRLRELVKQKRLRLEQSVTGNGHVLAMLAAAAELSPIAALAHNWQGLTGIRAIKALDDSLDSEAILKDLAERLRNLRDTLLTAPRQLLLIGESEARQAFLAALGACWEDRYQLKTGGHFNPPAKGEYPVRQAWTVSTQVNFCAKAYPAAPAEHPDAPALMVLAGFLRNNFLHRAIREQGGAYGGGATVDLDAGAFRFFSYRDPRLAETLADFDASVDWLFDRTHESRLIEEAILGVIGSIDKPASPAGEAKKAFHAALHGRTAEQRRRFRSRVLEVQLEDLRRVAETYLRPERASTAVITSETTLSRYPEQDLQVMHL
ncbi:peptidase M16C associated domain-containing protein [Methylocaldum marinum]|uniref:Peptidase M16C associated domain-containing protein n=1 Tax=Methylocaldum marinum TaxID=1432792 RepID=A0A250KNB2_9GAMM|nr:insulinase family protein [Methylocaldum marinum]BBA33036.1 peptidase M16C associated domain-containing protein [Methylocaldum marinum]